MMFIEMTNGYFFILSSSITAIPQMNDIYRLPQITQRRYIFIESWERSYFDRLNTVILRVFHVLKYAT